MNDRNVDVVVIIKGSVPMLFLPKLFDMATAMTPEDGQLSFEVDGAS